MLKPNKADLFEEHAIPYEPQPTTVISLLKKQLSLLEETKQLQSEKIIRLETELAVLKKGTQQS